MRVYQDFYYYSDGIYEHSRHVENNKRETYHSVRIVGWGEEYVRGQNVKFWVSFDIKKSLKN